MTERLIREVRDRYSAAASSSLSGAQAGVEAVARAFGYTAEELAAVPAEANMGLSCGNPTAFANLRPGEVVVDLGCGGGLDVLLAARKVGPTGKAIGIDMTPAMIDRARANARKAASGGAAANVEFHVATIDSLPLLAESVDCLVSNCVINLAPDKRTVFREMYRVLRTGGRVAVSDIALKKPLPEDLARDVGAYVGCIAGALAIDDYERGLREAGFGGVSVVDGGKDLNAYAQVEGQAGCCAPTDSAAGELPLAEGCCTPTTGGTAVHDRLGELLRKYDINDYAASVCVYALKGAAPEPS
jgi:SAM-dependent methyltransferase